MALPCRSAAPAINFLNAERRDGLQKTQTNSLASQSSLPAIITSLFSVHTQFIQGSSFKLARLGGIGSEHMSLKAVGYGIPNIRPLLNKVMEKY